MNKKWSIVELVISCILIMWGTLAFITVIAEIKKMEQTGFTNAINTSVFKLILQKHVPLIVCLMAIYGSITTLMNKKIGWIFCITSCFMFAYFFFLSAKAGAAQTQQNAFAANASSYYFSMLLFLLLGVLLLMKPFRIKFKPAGKDWTILVVIILALLIDKIIY
jgi:hypothetical protein